MQHIAPRRLESKYKIITVITSQMNRDSQNYKDTVRYGAFESKMVWDNELLIL